jgi:hypothetical protein
MVDLGIHRGTACLVAGGGRSQFLVQIHFGCGILSTSQYRAQLPVQFRRFFTFLAPCILHVAFSCLDFIYL